MSQHTGGVPPPDPRVPEAGAVRQSPPAARAEELLAAAIAHVEAARPMPLSTSAMVNRDELLELLRGAVDTLPEELRAARWVIKEREDYLARARREGEAIIATARARAQQFVQRTEIVRAAEHRARVIVDEAEERARRLRLETEDWCDQRLAALEVALHRTLRSLAAGRERLQGRTPEPDEGSAGSGAQPETPEGFFDQDETGP